MTRDAAHEMRREEDDLISHLVYLSNAVVRLLDDRNSAVELVARRFPETTMLGTATDAVSKVLCELDRQSSS